MDKFKKFSVTAALATSAIAPAAAVMTSATANAAPAGSTHHVVITSGEHRMSDTWPA